MISSSLRCTDKGLIVGLIYYPALAAVVLKDEDVSIMSWDRVKVTGAHDDDDVRECHNSIDTDESRDNADNPGKITSDLHPHCHMRL